MSNFIDLDLQRRINLWVVMPVSVRPNRSIRIQVTIALSIPNPAPFSPLDMQLRKSSVLLHLSEWVPLMLPIPLVQSGFRVFTYNICRGNRHLWPLLRHIPASLTSLLSTLSHLQTGPNRTL